MDFDTLITIGVIIYFIYSIRKTLSSAKKNQNDQKQKTAGWAGKLGDFVNNIKEEIEKSNQELTAEKESNPQQKNQDNSFWQNIREPDIEKSEYSSKTINQTLFYEAKNSTPNKLEQKQKSETTIDLTPCFEENHSHRNYHGTCTMQKPIRKEMKKASDCLKLNMKKADLKKAIIWSEIISKPVSLRE